LQTSRLSSTAQARTALSIGSCELQHKNRLKHAVAISQALLGLTGRCSKVDLTRAPRAAGHGAGELVPDGACLPIRGQIRRVVAPWVKHVTFLDDAVYILPNIGSCVVGGTQQRGDGNAAVDPVDTERIWAAATALYPALRGAEVIKDWARALLAC
jgi:FAD dependent oxidoreductase